MSTLHNFSPVSPLAFCSFPFHSFLLDHCSLLWLNATHLGGVALALGLRAVGIGPYEAGPVALVEGDCTGPLLVHGVQGVQELVLCQTQPHIEGQLRDMAGRAFSAVLPGRRGVQELFVWRGRLTLLHAEV